MSVNRPALAFVGGIADSGKSPLLEELVRQEADKTVLRVSDSLKISLGFNQNEKLPPAVTLTDWKVLGEPDAVKHLCSSIREAMNAAPGPKAFLLNTHFATHSPSGFLPGLDPDSIFSLCEACNLTANESKVRVAVVLIDIGVASALRLRQKDWKAYSKGAGGGPALTADLDFNRLYSLYYYHTLCSILPRERVLYRRLVLQWDEVAGAEKPIAQTEAFKAALAVLRATVKDLLN